jgi:hypothetical protein
MAKLVNCKSCGNEVSKGAKSCPNCGADQRSFFAKHKILTVVGVLVILGIIGSLGGGGDDGGDNAANTAQTATGDVASSQTEQSTPAKAEPKEPPIVITTDDLLDALDANALNASKTYKGKYVEVTGVLSVIDSSGKYFSLTRNDGALTFINVTCNIGKEHEDDVANFSKEQTVTVVGTISDVGEILGYTIKVETIK